MTVYYQDDLVTLHHGDCEEILTSISDVDLVVTSPPYNLGHTPWPSLGHWKPGDRATGSGAKWKAGADAARGVSYDEADDSMPHDEYVAWQKRILALCWASLTDDGAIYYNHKPRVIGERLWLPLELTEGLPLRQIVTWARSGGTNPVPTAYMPTFEWIMILAKSAWRLRDRSASGVGDVWKIPQEMANSHPAPFPVAIPSRAIETTGARRVLDPFAGSGTTLRAAVDHGVEAVGIEKSERYCEMAALRLQQRAFDFRDFAMEAAR